MNNSKLMFFFLMIFSMLISISSNSWLACWMGLEINTFSFLTFIFKKKNFLSSETSINFFLIQSISSINMLFMIFLINWNLINISLSWIFMLNITICLLFKVGSAPFHFWMISLIESMNWSSILIFLSIQKIIPIVFISYYLNMKFMYLMILINCFIGGFGGLNQLSTRKIMSYSSIFNFSWMFSSIMISEIMFIIFISIYTLIMMNIFFLFKLTKLSYINQLYLIKNNNFIIFLILFNLLSLAGMPPLLGFMTEWLISIYFIESKNFIILFILMLSLINMYYYIQMFYPFIFIDKFQIKWSINLNYKMFILSYLSSMGLIFLNMMFLFY